MRDKEIRILCYGDSNTWGYISGSIHNRYSKNQRWTGSLQDLFGEEHLIIEEGLNSRTLISNDEKSVKERKNGSENLMPCLGTHDPIDYVILMLGTNELKAVYNKNVEEIGSLIKKSIKVTLNRKTQFLETTPKLIIGTAPLGN